MREILFRGKRVDGIFLFHYYLKPNKFISNRWRFL